MKLLKLFLIGLVIFLLSACATPNANQPANDNSSQPAPDDSLNQPLIGGERDEHGCLIAAGYAFDEEVGACIRAFDMTPDIKHAAQIAVEKVGTGYALTVVSFNSYEEPGAYDITLEQGLARTLVKVIIKNWQVVSVGGPDATDLQNLQVSVQDILARKYDRPLSEVQVKVNKQIGGFASGSVFFGQGGPGEGGMWLAVLDNGWSVIWDGNGSIDCAQIKDLGFPQEVLTGFCD